MYASVKPELNLYIDGDCYWTAIFLRRLELPLIDSLNGFFIEA
jgi:hypothetical protein